MRKRLFLSLLLVVALAAACGDDGGEVEASSATTGPATTSPATTDPATTGPDSPVSSPAGTTPDDGTATDVVWARIEPTDDLIDRAIRDPDSVVPDPEDPNAVLVRFYGGVQDCYGARVVVVRQDAEEIVLRLETGGRPVAVDTACIDIAEAQELQVVLDAPVGDRLVVSQGPIEN